MVGARTRIAACLVAVGDLAACGSSGSSGGGATSDTSAATSATSASSSAAGAGSSGPVMGTLKHVPPGTSVLTYHAAAKTLTGEIKLVGLAPSSSPPPHTHPGSAAPQGPVHQPLNPVMAHT